MPSSPTITLQSVTGVDVELRIAGAGSRSYAFVIDWHIRLILALAWLFTALFLYAGTANLFDSIGSRGMSQMIVWAPAAAVYLLYHPILEIVMRGSTPGKRMAGVRIVSRTGDIPSTGALLLRNVFRIVDNLPFAYLLGLAVVIFTEQHVRIGDLAAGTLLVHDEAGAVKSFDGLRTDTRANGLSPQSADLIHELLDRWWVLEETKRVDIARSLILRVDATTSAEALLLKNSQQLRSHLQALLSGNAA
ncbi:RDD family protein [Povalibacter sp.]|uniref:RDD family protein n=1 Tax=Povalibacter sp. TaxID=1962978 RepID=UPI002F429BA3